MCKSLIFALFLLRPACGNSPEESTPSDPLTLLIDTAVEAEVETSGFFGSILVACDKQIILHKAYGSINELPVATDSRFWISSTGKQFVSAAILRAQEKGLLSIDDSFGAFFPDIPKDKKDITIRQALLHMSGMGQSYVSETSTNREQTVAAMMAIPLAGEPGDEFRYSNNNFQMLAAILEVASGETYLDFLHQELLEPAGLLNTDQTSPELYASVIPTVGDLPVRLKLAYWGSQGMFSTTGDLFTWVAGLTSGDILSEESIGELFNPVAPIGEIKGAFSWYQSFTDTGVARFFTRGNDDFGANSLIYIYPDSDVIIIVLTHAGYRDENDETSFSRYIHRIIEDLIFP